MRTFVLTIKIGNAAVQSGEDLRDLIEKAAAEIREYSAEELQTGSLCRQVRDINGNKVGQWEVK